MDKRMMSFLRCPVTHKGLAQADSAVLRRINAAIDGGELSCRDGRVLSEHVAEGLITDDGIPVLLEGESIDMESIA